MTDLHAFAAYGPHGASARVRMLDWFRHLGIRAEVHDYAGFGNNRPRTIARHPVRVARAEWNLRRVDVRGQRVFVSREASPFSRGELEQQLLRSARHSVFDFDDALFHDAGTIRRILRLESKTNRLVAAADVVIAGNEYLGEWAGGRGRDVRVIPSCIEPRDYIRKAQWSIDRGAPSLVWLGTPSTEHNLVHIAPALLEVHRRSGATLTVVSAAEENPALQNLRHMLRRVPWHLETFAADLAGADIGLAPLDVSDEYNRGTCSYKLLQYAATGLPVVGSPVGANAVALERLRGVAAATTSEWVDGLLELIDSGESHRQRIGLAAIRGVESHYSFSSWAKEWSQALDLGIPTVS